VKETNLNILGKIAFVAFAAFFMVKYNYEVSQSLTAAFDFLWEARGSFITDLERTFDDAGIIKSFFLLIVLIVVLFGTLILGILIGGLIWIIVKLNDIYILPFILPLLVVYSKFSYAFIVRPLVRVLEMIFSLFGVAGKFLWRLLNLFVVIPLSEFISLKGQPAFRLYRAATSLLFMIGSVCLLVGFIGVSATILRDTGVAEIIESAVTNIIEDEIKSIAYKEDQYQVEVKASQSYWTKTGIFLEKGNIVSFNATGLVRANNPFGSYALGPDGQKDFLSPNGYMSARRLTSEYRNRGYTPSNYILDDKAINGLIGKVGTGEPFFVGSFKEYKAHQPGEILFGINQVWLSGAWKNNSGKFDVSIVIKRK